MRVFYKAFIFFIAFTFTSVAQDSDNTANKHFDNYLAKCSKNEVRCLWFSNVGTGFIMKLDLTSAEVFTMIEDHDRSRKGGDVRKLTYRQTRTLKELVKNMPKSSDAESRLDSVFISFQKDGKVITRKYLRYKLPRAAERIYDIGGGDIETVEADKDRE